MTLAVESVFASKPTDNAPVIFLHGFLGSAQDWSKVSDYLTASADTERDFHFLDLPGHGRSLKQLCQSFDYVVEAIKAVLAKLSITQFHLVGYSLGGRVALALAKAIQGQSTWQLKSLVLESTNLGLTDELDKRARQQADAQWATKFMKLPMKNVLTQWYQQAVFCSLTHEQRTLLIEKRSENNKEHVAQVVTSLSLANQPDAHETLCQIQSKVYLLTGEQDTKFVSIAKQMKQQYSQIQVNIFSGQGHNCHVFAPQKYTRYLHEVWRENDSKSNGL